LALIVRAAQREMVLAPDQERGPVPAGSGEGLVQGVQLRRGHANVDGAAANFHQLSAGLPQEFLELAAQGIVCEAQFAARLALIGDIVRRVREHHAGWFAGQHGVQVCPLGGIPTEQAMLSQDPPIAGQGDGQRWYWGRRIGVGASLGGSLFRQAIATIRHRRWPAKRLVAIWSSLPGVQSVKKFQDHKAAARLETQGNSQTISTLAKVRRWGPPEARGIRNSLAFRC
jgi:hypothetical protein